MQSNARFQVKQRVNIILSPQFYWVRLFNIPVKTQKEALQACASLFDEFLDTENLKYYTIKVAENKFLSFAYDEEKIVNAIKDSNLNTSQVLNIYFAQNELKDMIQKQDGFATVDNINLSVVDDVLVQVPSSFSIESKELNLDSLDLSKYKVPINFSSKYIDIKSSYILSAVLILFTFVNFSKAFDNFNYSSKIPKKIEQLKKQASMPSTMIQTKSILKKLNRIKLDQNDLREKLNYIFNIKNATKARILSFELKNENILIKLKGDDAKKITQYLEKKYNLSSAVVKNEIITIGMKL